MSNHIVFVEAANVCRKVIATFCTLAQITWPTFASLHPFGQWSVVSDVWSNAVRLASIIVDRVPVLRTARASCWRNI